jgi:hypothetical protein
VEAILDATGTIATTYSVSPIETLRAAIGTLEAAGFPPTAVVFNPADSQAIDLAKDDQNRYHGAGPFGSGPQTIWGYPACRRLSAQPGPASSATSSRSSSAGETGTVLASDQGVGIFDKNLLLLRAEARVAVGVGAPPAFAIADLTA